MLMNRVFKRLIRLEKLSFLEQYAMFMGKTQLVESALKQRLVEKYGFDEARVEKWTLGRAINELESNGLRPDFIALLRELLEYRNDLAHEFLAVHAFMQSLAGSKAGRLSAKQLRMALYKVEEVIVVHDFLNENGGL